MLWITFVSFIVLLQSSQGQDLDETFRSIIQSELTAMEERLKDHMATLIGGLEGKMSDGMCASRLSQLEDKLVVVLDEIRRMKDMGNTKLENTKNKWGEPDDGGWYLAFRGTAGVGKSVYDAYKDSVPVVNIEPCCQKMNGSMPCAGHFRNNAILDNWQNIQEVSLRLYNKGELKQNLTFNAVGTDYMSWFSKEKLIDAGNWKDLSGQSTTNFFSISGHPTGFRRFYINRNYGGCDKDAGWLTVVDNTRKHCQWEKGRHSFPNFLYSNIASPVTWQSSTQVSSADVMAIFVKPSGKVCN